MPKTYKTLFLDMDHTLCDTQRADDIGQEYLTSLFAGSDLGTSGDCDRASAYYMHLLYHGCSDCSRKAEESENTYRGRLMQFGIKTHLEKQIALSTCEKWIQQLMEKRIQAFQFFEGVPEMLKELRCDYTLVVLSNGPVYSQVPKVKQVSMKDHVDYVVLAGEYPWQKPDARIFEKALSISNTDKATTIHVGDSLASDIAGAVNANMDSIWVHPDASNLNNEPTPTYSIRHITELPNILNSK